MDPKFDAYLDLLSRWNRAYNLTAVREPAEMVAKHLNDSLAVLPYVHGTTVLDVGTGAGLPGLVLAMADPRLEVTLLDSNGKKTRFCEYAIDALGVDNARVVQSRVEDYRPGGAFDTVVSRAFASVPDFVRAAGALCAPDGRMLAMKGARPDDELAALPPGWVVEAVHALDVPGLEAERHLAVLRKA